MLLIFLHITENNLMMMMMMMMMIVDLSKLLANCDNPREMAVAMVLVMAS